MHGLPHRVVAAKREGHIAQPAADQGVGQALLDQAAGLEIRHCVVAVLLHAGGHRQDVGVEDDVFRGEAHLVHQDAVSPPRHLEAPFRGVRLALLIEAHHHNGRPVAFDQPRLLPEGLRAFLQADGVHHAFALQAAQPGLDDRPAGRVHHDRHAADVRLAGDQQEEIPHQLLGIQQGLVHAHIDHLGAVFHLLPGDLQGLLQLAVLDEFQEAGRTRHIGALADVDEIGGRGDGQRLQAAEPAMGGQLGNGPGGQGPHSLPQLADMLRGRAATPADDVEKAAARKLFQDPRHVFRRLVVRAEFIGQTGVGMDADMGVGNVGKLLNMAAQVLGA